MTRAAVLLGALVCGLNFAAGDDARDARIMIAMSKGLGRFAEEAAREEAAGFFDRAAQAHEKALAVTVDVFGENDDLSIKIMRRLGQIYARLRNYEQAEKTLSRALAAEKGTSVEILHQLADMHTEAMDYAKAEPFYRQVLAIRRSQKDRDPGGFLQAVSGLGVLYYSLGNYAAAEPLLKEAVEVSEAKIGPDHPITGAFRVMLAALYEDAGRLDLAEQLARKVVDSRPKAADGKDQLLIDGLELLATVNLAKGRLDEAESLLKRAIDLTGGLHAGNSQRAELAERMSMVCLAKGDYAGAIDYGIRAEVGAARESGPTAASNGPLLSRQMELWAEVGQPGQAIKRAQDAWAIYSRQRERVYVFATEPEQVAFARTLAAHFNQTMALVTERMTADPPARRFGLELVLATKCAMLDSLARRQAAIVRDEDPRTQALREQWRTAAILLDVAELEPPDPKAPPGASRQRIEAFRQQKKAAEEALARSSVRFAEGRKAESAGVAEVAAALAGATGAGAAPALVEFVRYYSDLPTPISREEQIVVRYRSLERLNLLNKDAKPPPGADRPFQPRASRPRSGEWKYAAFVLRPGRTPDAPVIAAVSLGPEKAIHEAVADWRRAASSVSAAAGGPAADQAALDRASRALASLVWAPIAPALAGCRRVYISPDGELAFVSFAALPGSAGKPGSFLIDDCDIAYVSSGRDLAAARQPAGELGPPLLVGNPDFGRLGSAVPATASASQPDLAGLAVAAGGAELRSSNLAAFAPLPGTRAEIEAIAAVLRGQKRQPVVLSGGDATEAAVKAAKRPAILHLATHGFFLSDSGVTQAATQPDTRGVGGVRPSPGLQAANPIDSGLCQLIRLRNPMHRSGVVLAGANDTICGRRQGGGNDGILTAEEVTAADLWGSRMVVISACESGIGQASGGEGVFGLRRAFMLAGAGSLVMSLWQVPDRETCRLMESLYRLLGDSGTPQAALLAAQRAWIAAERAAGRYPHPFYWAGFVASGIGM